MATYLKEATFNGSNGSHFYIKLTYDLSQSQANNQSYITYYAYVGSYDGYSGYGTSTPFYVNGSQVGSFTQIPARTETYIGSLSTTINHNDDGSGTASYSASASTPWTGVGSASLSGSLSLPKIARASTVTATDAYIGSATSINISRASSSYTHTLTYSFEELTGTIATDVTTSYGWTVPDSFYEKIPNTQSSTCTVVCKTYSGSTLIGQNQTSFKASVNPDICKPELTVAAKDVNDTTKALTGSEDKVIKYFSSVEVTATPTAKNSATISSTKIVCGDGKILSENGTFENVESGVFTATTVDSRGLSQTVTNTLDLVEYIKLTLNATFYRTSATNNEVALVYNGNYFNQSFGVSNNTLTLKYRYKEHSSTNWSSYASLSPTISDNAYSNGTSPKSLGTSFDYQKAYDFEIVASDKLSTVTLSATVVEGVPVFDWGKSDFQHNTPVYLSSGNEVLDYDVVDEW